MKTKYYVVKVRELYRGDERVRTLTEKWREQDMPEVIFHCAHRPTLSVWDRETGKLTDEVFNDKLGNTVKEIEYDAEGEPKKMIVNGPLPPECNSI